MFVSTHVLSDVLEGTWSRMEKSEFDIIKFWLFYFLHPKELQILPCNVKEHIGPNNKAFFCHTCVTQMNMLFAFILFRLPVCNDLF